MAYYFYLIQNDENNKIPETERKMLTDCYLGLFKPQRLETSLLNNISEEEKKKSVSYVNSDYNLRLFIYEKSVYFKYNKHTDDSIIKLNEELAKYAQTFPYGSILLPNDLIEKLKSSVVGRKIGYFDIIIK